jgi:hypothetical protein
MNYFLYKVRQKIEYTQNFQNGSRVKKKFKMKLKAIRIMKFEFVKRGFVRFLKWKFEKF